jgi:hypothetical protein
LPTSFTLTINGVDYLNALVLQSVQITESAQIRGFSMACMLQINQQSLAKPLAGQFIIFSQDGVRQFAGRIATVTQNQRFLPTSLTYTLTCVDHSTDFDSILIQNIFPSQDIGDTVRQVVGQVGRGFTVNNVENGPIIGEQDVDLEVPSAVIQRVADSVEYQWFIDYYRDVNFFFLRNRAAPIPEIDIDLSTTTYEDLEWHEEWEQVKNRIYLTGAKAKSEFLTSEQFLGDGTQRFYPLGYEPFDPASTSISLNSVPQQILLDSVDGQSGDGKGASGQVYLCIDNWGIRFPDNFPPPNTQPVVINYQQAFEPVTIVEDPDSIARMLVREDTPGAPSDGVHELRFEIPGLRVDSEDTLVAYGQILLARYAKILFVATFTSYVQDWTVGQNFRLVSSAGRRDIDEIMFVRRIQKSIRYVKANEAVLQFEIEAASTPFVG